MLGLDGKETVTISIKSDVDRFCEKWNFVRISEVRVNGVFQEFEVVMATLIEVRSGKKVIGRCDEKCYMAEHERCSCICDGKNHGKGLRKASFNTEQNGQEMIRKFCGDRQDIDRKVLFDTEIHQLGLFEMNEN